MKNSRESCATLGNVRVSDTRIVLESCDARSR
jgi:hypothetical protein